MSTDTGHWFRATLNQYNKSAGWQDAGEPDYATASAINQQGNFTAVYCPPGFSRRWALDQLNQGKRYSPPTLKTELEQRNTVPATRFVIEGQPDTGGTWRVVDTTERDEAETNKAIVSRYQNMCVGFSVWTYRAKAVVVAPPEPKVDLWVWDGVRWIKQFAGCTKTQAEQFKLTYGLKEKETTPVDAPAPEWRPVRTISFTFGGRTPSPRQACEAMAAQMSVTELKAFITEGANEAARQTLRAEELAAQQKRNAEADESFRRTRQYDRW